MSALRYLILMIVFSFWSLESVVALTLPKDFVHLKQVDNTIIQSVRYAGSENFIGRPVNGYHSKTDIVMTKQAAQALKKVQREFKLHGYSLVVYDAYRPQQAVDNFIKWAKDSTDQKMKKYYYPTIDKRDVFRLNYVAKKSGHTRGSTVDLTLIKLPNKLHQIIFSTRILKNGEVVLFLDDGTVDMGSSFDLFHEVSHPDTFLIDEKAQSNRKLLYTVMNKYGFIQSLNEWWHFRLLNEPFPETYFNFTVQ